jgi:hypothetical protein
VFRIPTTLAAVALVAGLSRPGAAQQAPTPLRARLSVGLDQVTGRVPVPRWGATDLELAGAFVTALWVDAAQTRSLARSGWRDFRESNPLLGRRPTEGQINTYTAVVAVTTLGVAAVLPRRARRWWLAGAAAVEGYTVAHTTRVGVAIRLR